MSREGLTRASCRSPSRSGSAVSAWTCRSGRQGFGPVCLHCPVPTWVARRKRHIWSQQGDRNPPRLLPQTAVGRDRHRWRAEQTVGTPEVEPSAWGHAPSLGNQVPTEQKPASGPQTYPGSQPGASWPKAASACAGQTAEAQPRAETRELSLPWLGVPRPGPSGGGAPPCVQRHSSLRKTETRRAAHPCLLPTHGYTQPTGCRKSRRSRGRHLAALRRVPRPTRCTGAVPSQ